MQITEVLTASKVLIKTLTKLGVDTIFGYPGSAVLPIYDELSRQEKIKHILLRHEQSAVHAAEGYARVSGKCGVVLVTAGPGATNTVTGIANAYLDGYPLVVISGQVSRDMSGKDAFQEVNFTDIVKSCTKAAFKVTDASEVESTILQAFLIATTGKKGPVVVDIPKDVLFGDIEYKNLALPTDRILSVSDFDVERAVEMLSMSKFPLVVCGGGVLHSGATAELLELVNELNIPVVSTMMGVGAFPETHPNYAGMIGLYGEASANLLVESADLVLVLGARFNDRVTSAFDIDELNRKTIIQVDINSKELIRNLSPDLAVNADIKDFVSVLCSKLPQNLNFEPFEISRSSLCEDKMTSSVVLKKLYDFVKDSSAVVAVEVGQHQISLIKNFKFTEPHKFLTSGGLGAMGFGFGAAIGASIAMGKKPVLLVTGDGSFQMNSPELAVCSELNIPVKVMIMNNGYLGMVRQLQDEQFGGRHYETALTNPDFVMLAQSYGIKAVRVESVDSVNVAFERAFEENVPFVIEFVTDSEENV